MQRAVRSRRVNEHLRKALSAGHTGNWEELNGEHYVAVGLGPGRVDLHGRAGDYFASLNDGACIQLNGDAGNYAADTATAGEVIVEGRVGSGLAFSNYGGTVVVKGNAGNDVGQMNKGGTVLVGGSVGDRAGLYALTGTIVVLGDTGAATGDWLVGGTLFVGGTVGELGRNASIGAISPEEFQWLAQLLDRYQMTAEPTRFQKIVPSELRPFYPEKKQSR